MNEIEYSEGSKILVTKDGVQKVIEVTLRDEEIKNGEPGWEGFDQNGAGHWGYDSEIEKVY